MRMSVILRVCVCGGGDDLGKCGVGARARIRFNGAIEGHCKSRNHWFKD